jgi:glycosyltransferase involved in cell wall biosynthesis
MPDGVPLPVSAVVLTHNEERNLADCLDSLASLVDEIFVVDSGSTDSTLSIATCYTSNVVEHPFENYSRQRNWSQQNLALAHNWVLHVDADERVSAELAGSLRQFFSSGQYLLVNGAMFSRRTVFMDRWMRHGGHYPAYHVRLFQRDKGHCEDRLYDQHFIVEDPIARLHGDLIDVLAPDLDTWSLKHIRWAAAEARELRHQQPRPRDQIFARLGADPIGRRRWLRSKLFANSPPFVRALLYFAYRYVIRRGFLDGTEGLIFHVLHGFWYRFYIDAKIWESEHSPHPVADGTGPPTLPKDGHEDSSYSGRSATKNA